MTAIVEESLGNAPLVQAYNGQAAAAAGFEQETRTVMATQLALERLRAGYAPLVSLIEVAGMLIVIGVGAIDLAEGRLTLGGLLAFLAYLSQLYGRYAVSTACGVKRSPPRRQPSGSSS